MGRTSWGASWSGFWAYARLVQQWGHPTDCCMSDELDELLMAVSQQYEQSSQQYEAPILHWGKIGWAVLEGSQLLNVELLNNSMVVKPSGKQQVDVKSVDNPVVAKPSGKCQFGQSQSEKDIQAVKESRVPKKTLQNTEWAQRIWCEWATHRLLSAENCGKVRNPENFHQLLWTLGRSRSLSQFQSLQKKSDVAGTVCPTCSTARPPYRLLHVRRTGRTALSLLL